jgi:putative endonuclease
MFAELLRRWSMLASAPLERAQGVLKMYIYLIHFNAKIGNPNNPRGQAQHYLGSTFRLDRRMEEHLTGRGAALMRAVREQGIPWQIARIWPGDRAFERRLKRRKEAPRLCPICRAAVQDGQLPLDFPDLFDDVL